MTEEQPRDPLKEAQKRVDLAAYRVAEAEREYHLAHLQLQLLGLACGAARATLKNAQEIFDIEQAKKAPMLRSMGSAMPAGSHFAATSEAAKEEPREERTA